MRATGAGKSEVRTDPPSLMIFNFDIDGDALKPEHKAFLRQEARPKLLSGFSASVVGSTDRSASDAHNKALSDRRVANTIAFLRQEVGELKLSQATGFGEEIAKKEGKADGSSDERFRAVIVFLTAAPIVTRNKVIEVTGKSFINVIGPNIGAMPGTKIVLVPPTPLNPFPVPVPVQRQTLLNLMAAATDLQFGESPVNSFKDKRYRLFTSVRFTVVFEDGKILAATPQMTTDVGLEGPIQPPPLIATVVTVSPRGGPTVQFSWFGKGKPDPKVEPGFQEIRSRTSVFIWHIVEGEIDVSSGTPVAKATIRGSRFPSHRVFINNQQSFPEQRQGVFSNLWDPDLADSTRVR